MTCRKTKELFDRIEDYPEIQKYFILLKYAIINNEFTAINISQCINYLIKNNLILNQDFGSGCNFLHFLIINYDNKDDRYLIYLIKNLYNNKNIFYDLLSDDNNDFKSKPINLGFNELFFNKNTIKNILLILFFIKNKEKYDKLNRNIFFDMNVWKTIVYLNKLKINNNEIKKIENILYVRSKKEKHFNHFVYPL